MHIDKFLEVSDAQAVTATAPSTDVIDTKQLRSNLGMSELEMVVTLAETATAAGAATVTVTLQDSADNSAWRDIASKTLAIADMKAGAAIPDSAASATTLRQFSCACPICFRKYGSSSRFTSPGSRA